MCLRTAILSILAVAAGSLLGGCGPAGYDLRVSLDPQFVGTLGDENVFLHVIPVTAANRWQLQTMSLDAYWQYGGPSPQPRVEREKGTRMFELSAAHPSARLERGDPDWAAWQESGVEALMLISSRPAPAREQPGEQDPRRRMIAAGTSPWNSRRVDVVVSATGLIVQERSQ